MCLGFCLLLSCLAVECSTGTPAHDWCVGAIRVSDFGTATIHGLFVRVTDENGPIEDFRLRYRSRIFASPWEKAGPIAAGFTGVTDMSPGGYDVQVCIPNRELITGRVTIDEASSVPELTLRAGRK